MVQRNSLKIMTNQVSIIKLQANGVFMTMYTDGSSCASIGGFTEGEKRLACPYIQSITYI